ncbi:MAG: hypothetical protein BMS9Abin10_0344 [Gammaproteobacteria bacterium]|nr:MAG: hypothetical protein BMS9Abin10_0344 [Gammaproteobacteria bacterium]
MVSAKVPKAICACALARQKQAGALHASSSQEVRRRAFLAPAFPASLERPVRTVRGAPARRDDGSLDRRLFPPRPCPCGGRTRSFSCPFRPGLQLHFSLGLSKGIQKTNNDNCASSSPLFAFFASLSCFARKTRVRHPWRTRSPGRRFTGSPPIIRLAPRRLARRKAPQKSKTQHLYRGLRMRRGFGLTRARDKNPTSQSSVLTSRFGLTRLHKKTNHELPITNHGFTPSRLTPPVPADQDRRVSPAPHHRQPLHRCGQSP